MRVRAGLVTLGATALLGLGCCGAAVASPAGWTIQPTPGPTQFPEAQELFGVSCATPNACTATGSIGYGAPQTPLAATWNGTTWTAQPAADNGGLQGSALLGVTCPSSAQCIAVGYDTYTGGPIVPIAEGWNGVGWSLQPVPVPSGPPPYGGNNELQAVSCSSAAACTAVGSGDVNGPLAERWDGSSWQLQTVPGPPGGVLTGVSCPTATSCTAVGFDGAGTLAETWNGATWSIDSTPNPASGFNPSLTAVSCRSAGTCTAVGAYTAATGAQQLTLAERLLRGRWQIESTPNPAGAVYTSLAGVSCPTADSCTAVGSAQLSGNVIDTVAERRSGGRWMIEPTPNPRGKYSLLTAVSCPSTSVCTAVGYADGARLLAERYSGPA
jgi:hypothetical protein